MNDSNKEIHPNRFVWIDCAKAIASLAVLTDHTVTLLYNSVVIQRISYFSVTLFILLSGFTTFLSYEKKPSQMHHNLSMRQFKKIFFYYAFVMMVYELLYQRKILFNSYIASLFSFSQPILMYYILFYLQLVLISPYIYECILYCCSGKTKIIKLIFLTIIIILTALFCTKYTKFLAFGESPSVYGGGKFLFGGSYLFFFFLGMLLAKSHLFNQNSFLWKHKKPLFFFTLIAIIPWIVVFITNNNFSLDESIFRLWTLNPPGITIGLYALSIMLLIFCVISIGESYLLFTKIIIQPLQFCGRYSLDLYLWHKLFLELFQRYFPNTAINIWPYRLIVFVTIIGGPIFFHLLASKFIQKIKLAQMPDTNQ